MNERQARELAPLLRKDPAEVVEVWKTVRAQHGDNVTAENVRQVTMRRLDHLEAVERQKRGHEQGEAQSRSRETDRQLDRRVAKAWLENLDVALLRVNRRLGHPPWPGITPGEARKRLDGLGDAIRRLQALVAPLEERADTSKPRITNSRLLWRNGGMQTLNR